MATSVDGSSSYYNFTSDLFSNLSSNNTNSASSNILGDYASIKSGTYKKLLKAYYAKEEQESKETSTTKKADLTSMKEGAQSLKAAADQLKAKGEGSLFEKVTKTVKDEKTGESKEVTDYDYDAITKAVQEFADSYNSFLDSAVKQDSSQILKKTTILTNLMKKNAGLLTDAGVSIGANNKLTVDAEKLKEADINVLKTLVQGTNSIADKVATRAGDVYRLSATDLASAYTKRGNYQDPTMYNAGKLFDNSL